MKMQTLVKCTAIAVIPGVIVMPGMTNSAVAGEMLAPIANPHFSETLIRNREYTSPSLQGGENTIHYSQAPQEWTRAMDRRFEELAIKEAVGNISPGETDELESLTHHRRDLKYPRSAEEVLWEYKQRRLTANLVSAVAEYVKFHDLPDSERA